MKNMTQSKISEAARAAGFGTDRDCEITYKTLQRWVREEKLVTMVVGERTFYHLDTAKKLASELRNPAEGMVAVTSLTDAPSLQKGLINEARAGTIPGRKAAIDGKKGSWHVDEAAAKNWLSRRQAPKTPIATPSKPVAVGPVSAQVAVQSMEVEPEVIDVVRSMLRAHNKRATDAHDQMTALVERAEVVVERLVLALDRAHGTAPATNVMNSHTLRG